MITLQDPQIASSPAGGTDPLNQLPVPASSFAPDVDGLFYFSVWVSIASFAIIFAILVVAAIRFRRRSPEQPAASQFTHNTTLEVVWTLVPTVIVMLIFAWGWKGNLDQSVIPANAHKYRVVGQKWSWTFYHPGSTSSAPELWVPVDEPVRLTMTSQDWLHSFFVPAFRQKRDVVPGMRQLVWFQPTREGDYDIFCAEYCGDGHSLMRSVVHVVDRATFDEMPWVGKTPLEIGQQTYIQCQACHTLDGTSVIAPSFKGIWGREERLTDGTTVVVDEAYVRESILEPNKKIVEGFTPVMPALPLSEEQIEGIIEYMKTL